MIQEAELPRTFKYVTPQSEKAKTLTKLCRTDILFAAAQRINKGGETTLHSHAHLDGFWMVLKGQVRFYGERDRVLGTFGALEGILIPRGTQYWFETVGEDPAEILQVEASDRLMRTEQELLSDIQHHTDRTDVEPGELFDAPEVGEQS
jgi:mannose-6-phosphate isomerase-like protein (cupin superfamily)